MSYLSRVLKGKAVKVILCLPLSESNILRDDLLQQHFRQKQVLLNAHMPCWKSLKQQPLWGNWEPFMVFLFMDEKCWEFTKNHMETFWFLLFWRSTWWSKVCYNEKSQWLNLDLSSPKEAIKPWSGDKREECSCTFQLINYSACHQEDIYPS